MATGSTVPPTGARDPVTVASIGLGWWGSRLAHAATAAGIRVATCFARDPSAQAVFAAAHGTRAAATLDDVLDDPEVEGVLLATPHSTHAALVTRAVEAGKHVFVEKPLTLTYADGRRCVDAAAAAGVSLQVGHNRRRQPATRRLKTLVDAGELGQIQQVEANLSNPRGLNPRTGWRGDPAECPAGGMTALGVHMVDNLVYLVGPVTQVSAFSRKVVGVGALDDATVAALEFASGSLGLLATSMVIPDVARTAAFGTEGAAWNEADGARFYRQTVGEPERTEHEVAVIDTVRDQLAEFGGCVRGERTPETDGAAALEVVAVLEALVESVDSGRAVDVDEIRARR